MSTKEKSKQSLAETMLQAVNKQLGRKSVILGDDPSAASDVKEVIPFGIWAVDAYVCNVGGLPVGRMVELYSQEGGGKSSLALAAAASCQQLGGIVAIADTEQTITSERMETFGVDHAAVMFMANPDSVESVLAWLDAMVTALPDGEGPMLLIWDSLAQTPSDVELTAGPLAGKKEMASERAKTIGRAIRTMAQKISSKRVVLLIVNQMRIKFGTSFGDNTTTPGGNGVKFYASIRLQVLGGSSIKDATGTHVGKDITVIAAKNKVGAPWRKAKARLQYATGFDDDWTTLQLAKRYKLGDKTTSAADATILLEAARAAGWPAKKSADLGDWDDGEDDDQDA